MGFIIERFKSKGRHYFSRILNIQPFKPERMTYTDNGFGCYAFGDLVLTRN